MNTIDVFVFNCCPISRAGCHGRVLLVKSRGAFYSISTPLRKLRNRILNFPGISIDSNERHRHGCSLFPINVQFAKVAVTKPGSQSEEFSEQFFPNELN